MEVRELEGFNILTHKLMESIEKLKREKTLKVKVQQQKDTEMKNHVLSVAH